MIFVYADSDIALNECNLFSFLIKQKNFLSFCEDNWEDTEFYKSNETLQKMAEDEKIKFCDFPFEWQRAIQFELQYWYVKKSFTIYDENEKGELVRVE